MSTVLKVFALAFLLVSGIALYAWLRYDVYTMHPAIALLMLAAAPFLYLMGKASEE